MLLDRVVPPPANAHHPCRGTKSPQHSQQPWHSSPQGGVALSHMGRGSMTSANDTGIWCRGCACATLRIQSRQVQQQQFVAGKSRWLPDPAGPTAQAGCVADPSANGYGGSPGAPKWNQGEAPSCNKDTAISQLIGGNKEDDVSACRTLSCSLA
ncbi:hypothetical protein NDU88_004193 [Pleurodeles waltl]|uniref:Uncharacterized protein n=1 Tax=Pleurodeles waltl TaxID=8319 RepID=A0AAV7VI57_PLEWA|nr:hypothetical protein NDU88_004193 [Pleurodeles waltl]